MCRVARGPQGDKVDGQCVRAGRACGRGFACLQVLTSSGAAPFAPKGISCDLGGATWGGNNPMSG